MTDRHPITVQTVVYTTPATRGVTVVRDVPYGDTKAGALGIDIYYPPGVSREGSTPAVVFATGFSDVGARTRLGCAMKDMASYVGWARLVAASGVIGITYENQNPIEDLDRVFDHVRGSRRSLGIDASRIGVWACSGNGPTGMKAVLNQSVVCGAFLYPYLLDLDSHAVAEASAQWGFANACAGRAIDDVPTDVPLLVVRAGRDQFAGVNASIDGFVARALRANLPITLINYADGAHGFDVSDDRPSIAQAIRSVLAFLRQQLVEDSSLPPQ